MKFSVECQAMENGNKCWSRARLLRLEGLFSIDVWLCRDHLADLRKNSVFTVTDVNEGKLKKRTKDS